MLISIICTHGKKEKKKGRERREEEKEGDRKEGSGDCRYLPHIQIQRFFPKSYFI